MSSSRAPLTRHAAARRFSPPPLPPLSLPTRLSQVKARLHTLEQVYDNSHLVLSTEQVKRLWACLGPDPVVPTPTLTSTPSPAADSAEAARAVVAVGAGAMAGEVSTLLSWLSKACEACEAEGGGGIFEPGVAAELFKVGRSRGWWVAGGSGGGDCGCHFL